MRANRRTPRINRAHLVGLGFESRPCGQLILRKFFPYSAATLSADLNVFHSLCDTLWKIMLPLETVTIFSWNSVVIWAMNQTDVHRPTKFPRIICTMSQMSTAPKNSRVSSALYHQTDIHRPTKFPRIICTISSHECTVRQEPDLWEKNPVFSVDWVQVYIRMGDTWSGWQDNGNIMDPGPNIHHIAAFRSYRPTEDQIPISWTTYMRVLNCVLLCPPYNSDSWNRNFHCVFYSKYSVFNP